MSIDISAVFHGTLHDPSTWIHDGFIIGQLHFAISRNQIEAWSLPGLWTGKRENDKQRFRRLFAFIPKRYVFIYDFHQNNVLNFDLK
jgi:hypothetical protein